MRIEVSSTEREVFIKFNDITHCRFDRRELSGLSSWIIDRGRVTKTYAIDIVMKNGPNIQLEYDNFEKWKTVLDGLDATPFLNEWKVQDP
jgi:hypothetical protein